MKSNKSNSLKNLTVVVLMLVSANVIRGQELVVDFTYTPDNPCSGIIVSFNSEVSGGSGNPANWIYDWRIDWVPFGNQPDFDFVFNAFGCGNQEYAISLIVQDISFTPPEQKIVNKTIQVKRRPNPMLDDIENIVDFSNCDNYPPPSPENPQFTVVVNDVTPNQDCILPNSYTIEWGDGNVSNNLPLGFTNLSHTYTHLGAYEIKFMATGDNGCEGETTYLVRNETYPTGAFDLHGNYSPVCAPITYQFFITGHEDNSAATTYSFDFGDGNAIQYLHNSLLPPYNVIEHTYTTSSCTSSPPYFLISMTIENSCGSGFASRSTSIVWAAPVAGVDITLLTGYEGDCIEFINLSTTGYEPGCIEYANYFWNFGNGNTSTLKEPPCQVFHVAGIYDGYLIASNFCNPDGDTLHFQVYIDEVTGIPEHGIGAEPLFTDFRFLRILSDPFSTNLTVEFELIRSQPINLTIYNLLGQKVITLVNDLKADGKHMVIWDGKNDAGNDVPGGIYFLSLTNGIMQQSQKVAIVR